MKTIEINHINKLWYVIIKKNGENVCLASFTTKKAATSCKAHWMENNPDLMDKG